jgi:GntR family transcriptional regulator, transcriptional repressor for pyruvate dehydrogenase complex
MSSQQAFSPAISHQSLHQQVARNLEEGIISGRYVVGSALPTEKELAQQFGVGLTAVRYAIRILAARGLVESRRGLGTMVTQDGRQSFVDMLGLLLRRDSYDYEELVGFRRLIEAEAAFIAAGKVTEHELNRMRYALDKFYAATESGDFTSAGENHTEFHIALVTSAGNQVFIDFLVPILRVITHRTALLEEDSNRIDEQRHSHEAVYDALKGHDAEKAQALLRVHLAPWDEQMRQLHRILAGRQSEE